MVIDQVEEQCGYASMEYGALFVITTGIYLMLEWCADNYDGQGNAFITVMHEIPHNPNNYSCQLLKHTLVHFTEKDLILDLVQCDGTETTLLDTNPSQWNHGSDDVVLEYSLLTNPAYLLCHSCPAGGLLQASTPLIYISSRH